MLLLLLLVITYSLLVRAASRVAYGPSSRMCSFKKKICRLREEVGEDACGGEFFLVLLVARRVGCVAGAGGEPKGWW